MDTYRQSEQVIIPAPHANTKNTDAVDQRRKHGILHSIFATNWGFVLIGALVALGLGVSALHADYVESNTEMHPAEVESAIGD